ncbi:MAG: hypothetical protein JWP97_6261 [Labilithrix sp.]|nr:hypothetical protein [Labilithrix sp.]
MSIHVPSRPRSSRLARSVVACAALALVFAFSVARALSAGATTRIGPEPREPRSVQDVTVREGAARAKLVTEPIMLRDAEGTLLAFPPKPGIAAPLAVVYLHGIHGRAENGCPWLRDGATDLGWLVCPRANERLPGDTYSWSGTAFDVRAVVARAERAAQVAGADPARGTVLVGFSQGAYVAMDLLRARLGSYRGLVLIGAEVAPDRALLQAAGVSRVVLAAGELDASAGPLRRAAERLGAEGADVRFASLGAIGHSYQTTDREALRDAIAWAGGAR